MLTGDQHDIPTGHHLTTRWMITGEPKDSAPSSIAIRPVITRR